MAVYNLNFLANHNIAKDREEGEDGRERRFAIDDEEGDVVDLQPIGQVAHTAAALVAVRDDYDFMAAVDELLRRAVSGRIRETVRRVRTLESW